MMKSTAVMLLLGAIAYAQGTQENGASESIESGEQAEAPLVDQPTNSDTSNSTTQDNESPAQTTSEPEILLGSEWNGLSNVLDILTDEPLTSEDGITYGTLNVKTAWKWFSKTDDHLKMGFWWDFTPSESFAAVEYDSTFAFAFAVDDVEEESSVAVFTSDEISGNGGTFYQYRYKLNIEKSLDTMTVSPIGPSETDDLVDAKLFPFLWQNGAEDFFISQTELAKLTKSFWAPNFTVSTYDEQTGKLSMYLDQDRVGGVEPGTSMALGIYATFGDDEISRVLTAVNWASEKAAEDSSEPDDQTNNPDTEGETNNVDSGSTNDETGSDSNGINENGTDGNGDDGVVNITNGDDVKADDGANAFVVFTTTMLVMTFALTQ